MTPVRVQLSRAKGWRMPTNTVKVDRTTKWGNPFTVAGAREAGYKGTDDDLKAYSVESFRAWLTSPNWQNYWQGPQAEKTRATILECIGDIRGKNLACWCKPGTPCHADVLLELANKGNQQ